MSLVLNLPPDLEAELTAEAAQLKIPLEEYALRILAVNRTIQPTPTNGAELVAYWKKAGLIGTRTDIVDSPEHARAIREKAQTRERSWDNGCI